MTAPGSTRPDGAAMSGAGPGAGRTARMHDGNPGASRDQSENPSPGEWNTGGSRLDPGPFPKWFQDLQNVPNASMKALTLGNPWYAAAFSMSPWIAACSDAVMPVQFGAPGVPPCRPTESTTSVAP